MITRAHSNSTDLGISVIEKSASQSSLLVLRVSFKTLVCLRVGHNAKQLVEVLHPTEYVAYPPS